MPCCVSTVRAIRRILYSEYLTMGGYVGGHGSGRKPKTERRSGPGAGSPSGSASGSPTEPGPGAGSGLGPTLGGAIDENRTAVNPSGTPAQAPTGTATEPGAQGPETGFPSVGPQVVSERPRAKAKKAVKVLSEDETAKTVGILCAILDGTAKNLLGEAAGFTAEERAMIEPPLVRILSRMDPAVLEKLATLSDPVMLLSGFGMWGMRLLTIQRSPRSEESPAPADTQPEPQSDNRAAVVPAPGGSNNGHSPEQLAALLPSALQAIVPGNTSI